MLAEAGLSRPRIRVINVTPFRPPGSEIGEFFLTKGEAKKQPHHHLCGRYFGSEIATGLAELREELQARPPKMVIALGATALWALTGETAITSWRGSMMHIVPDAPINVLQGGGPTVNSINCRVLPTYHPAAILRQWSWRSTGVHDLRRAAAYVNREWPIPLWDFTTSPTFAEAITFLDAAIAAGKPVACDIETTGRNISLVGVATSKTRALCIPFFTNDTANRSYWSAEEEYAVIAKLRELLESPRCGVIGQNFHYDAQHLLRQMGIYPFVVDDTMWMQHVLFPGTPKALDYIASLYCTEYVYWKDELKDYRALPSDEQKFRNYNCLAGDTRVLMANFQWKNLENVMIGDEILTFDDTNPTERNSRPLKVAKVTNGARSTKPTLKVTFASGRSIIGTNDHRIVMRKRRGGENYGTTWAELGSLKVGDRVPSAVDPKEFCDESCFESGWLAGIYDGEGSIGRTDARNGRSYAGLQVTQKPGKVLDNIMSSLRWFGFDYRLDYKKDQDVTHVFITGGLSEVLRFLTKIKTFRIADNFLKVARQNGWSGYNSLPSDVVTKIEPYKEIPVYDITTTCGTFIANGYLVHNCEDGCRTYEIWEKLKPVIRKAGLEAPYAFQISLFRPVLDMMVRGIRVDPERRKALKGEVSNRMIELAIHFEGIVGKQVGASPKASVWYRSPAQMCKLFYEEMGMKPILHHKTQRPTVNDEALMKIGRHSPVMGLLCDWLSEYSTLDTYDSTFLAAGLDPDGRVRCSYNVAGTENFRFSSSENAFGGGLNLQNIPRDKKVNVKAMFVPDPDHVILEWDLKQADLQVVVEEAGAVKLREMMDKGLDVYSTLASHYYQRDITKAMPERQLFKNVTHALDYVAGPNTLAATYGLDRRSVEKIKEWYLKSAAPEIARWHGRVMGELRSGRTVKNLAGYRRVFFDRLDSVLKDATAWLGASPVSFAINSGMLNLRRNLPWVTVLLQVHDSLVVQIAKERFTPENLKLIEAQLLVPLPPRTSSKPLIIPVDHKASSESWGQCG